MTTKTFGEVIKEYIDAREIVDGNELGKTDQYYIGRWFRENFDVLPVEDMDRGYIHKAITEERMMFDVKGPSIRRELNLLQAILNWAVANGDLAVAPKLIKPADSKPRELFLTVEQVELFLMLCPPNFRKLCALLFFTGARLGEARTARWGHIHDGCVVYTTRKGKSKQERKRTVPLTSVMLDYIDITGRHDNLDFIAPRFSTSSNAWPTSAVYPLWNKVRDIAFGEGKMSEVTPHTARHTFASHLVMNGVDPRTVAELMGHSTMDMMKRYTHLNTDHLKTAMQQLPYNFELRG